MIRKIISGGQTGADRAALDAATELGVAHGGWVPKDRLTEEGALPEKYQLREMPSSSYPKRTEQNVIDSDGTLIITHGELTGGSALTRKFAERHGRPCLHIDLNHTNALGAVKAISYWIDRHNIEVLNVAGPRASKDPGIYDAVKTVLESVLNINLADTQLSSEKSPLVPGTVEEALEEMMRIMHTRTLAGMAKMREEDLPSLHPTLGRYIRRRFGLWTGNTSLLQSCAALSGTPSLHPDHQ